MAVDGKVSDFTVVRLGCKGVDLHEAPRVEHHPIRLEPAAGHEVLIISRRLELATPCASKGLLNENDKETHRAL